MRYEERNLYGVLVWEVKNMASSLGNSCLWRLTRVTRGHSCPGWPLLLWALFQD
ncbi:unnamed protein product [Prunus brigantina]